MDRLTGDMAKPLYYELPPPAGLGAEAETATLLASGELPDGPLTLDHYAAAVERHRRGAISDAELTAVTLLVRLAAGQPSAKRANLLQPIGRGEIAYVEGRIGPLASYPPLLRRLGASRIKGIKAMARLALVGWHHGVFPGLLAIGKVTDLEILDAQAEGRRHVGLGLGTEEFRAVDDSYPGGFTHHDLCHLAKFRGEKPGNDLPYQGQVGFFAALARLVREEEGLWAASGEAGPERAAIPPGMDLTAVFADTNGDVRLLITLFLARLAAQRAVTKGEETAQLVATYLERLGMPPERAQQVAGSWEEQRAVFLTEVGAFFEEAGAALVGASRA